MMATLGWLFVFICCFVLGWFAWRFFVIRPSGTPIVVRQLPAEGEHGWRHGVVRYHDGFLEFFKLRSLSPRPDIAMERYDVSLTGRRQSTELEKKTLEDNLRILEITANGVNYELAVDYRGETAFTSWLESAPSQRLERANPAEAIKHFSKTRRSNRR